jgi:hypothetical protein
MCTWRSCSINGPLYGEIALNISRGITGKSESFIVLPLHYGSALLGFRPTAEYARGVLTWDAVGISGAAVEPGVVGGRKRFRRGGLMLFNARLGCGSGILALPDDSLGGELVPGLPSRVSCERCSASPLKRDPMCACPMAGTSKTWAFNEMVLRRCHFIVVSGAGQDSESS